MGRLSNGNLFGKDEKETQSGILNIVRLIIYWSLLSICFMSDVRALSAGLAWATTELEKEVRLGETKVSGRFHFKNSHAFPLDIFDVKSECTCLRGTVDKDVVQPGESGSLDFQIDLRGRREDVTKRLYVRTGGGEDSISILSVTVRIKGK